MSTTRRTTRNTEDQPTELKDILNDISQKLDRVNESLEKLVQVQQANEGKNTNTYDVLVNSINAIEQNLSSTIQRSENNRFKEEALRQRRTISKTWRHLLNKRKQLYWHALNCESTSVIYETWLQREKKVIPNKFLLKSIPNEDPHEMRIRQHSVINDFKVEISLLNARAARHRANCVKVDEEVAEFLNQRFQGAILAEMEKMWWQECKEEEAKSHKKWERKQEWLEGYEEEFESDDLIKRNKGEKTQRRDKTAEHQGEKKTRNTPKQRFGTTYHRSYTRPPQKNPHSRQAAPKSFNKQHYREQEHLDGQDRRRNFSRRRDERSTRKPTYAEVTRGPLNRQSKYERQPANAVRYNQRGQNTFLGSTHGGNYPPSNNQPITREQRHYRQQRDW